MGFLSFWYGCVAALLGIVAQVAGTMSAWAPSTTTILVLVVLQLVPWSGVMEYLSEKQPPLFPPTRPRVLVARTLLVVFAGQLLVLGVLAPPSSDGSGQAFLIAGFTLVNAFIAATFGVGLENAVGLALARVIRVPFNAWTAAARRSRAADLRKQRRSQRR